VSNLQGALAMKPHFSSWRLNWNGQGHGLIKYRPSIAIMSYKKIFVDSVLAFVRLLCTKPD